MNPRPGGWRRRWILLLAFLTPPCRTIVALGSRTLDEATGPWDRWRVRVHLSICTGCRRYLQQLEVLREAAQRSADRPPPSTRLSTESRDRIKRRLRCDPAKS